MFCAIWTFCQSQKQLAGKSLIQQFMFSGPLIALGLILVCEIPKSLKMVLAALRLALE